MIRIAPLADIFTPLTVDNWCQLTLLPFPPQIAPKTPRTIRAKQINWWQWGWRLLPVICGREMSSIWKGKNTERDGPRSYKNTKKNREKKGGKYLRSPQGSTWGQGSNVWPSFALATSGVSIVTLTSDVPAHFSLISWKINEVFPFLYVFVYSAKVENIRWRPS